MDNQYEMSCDRERTYTEARLMHEKPTPHGGSIPHWLRWAVIALASGVALAAAIMVYRIPLMQQRQVCARNLANLRYALLTYRSTHDGDLGSYQEYVAKGEIMETDGECPFTPARDAGTVRCDYAWIVGVTKNDPADWFVAFDRLGNHGDGTRHVVLVSGDVILVKEKRFIEMYEEFRRKYVQRKKTEPVIWQDSN